jgi:hypothetical protein
MTRLLTCITTACTLALAATPRLAQAQDSGVLLGLHVSIPDSGESYRTYWIARQGASVRLVAAGPDLLVPRPSAFWRVCVVEHHELSDGQLNHWDTVIAGPATAKRGKCAVRDKPTTEAEQQAAMCEMSSSNQIQFIASSAISIEQQFASTCGAHPSGGAWVSLRSLDTDSLVDFSSLVEPGRKSTLVAASLEAARAEFADFGRVDTLEAPDSDTIPGAKLSLIRQWAVERGAGHWQAVGQTTCSPYVACGDDGRRFSITGFAAPASLVGHDGLSLPFQAIKAAFPNVRDAVSSPRGDLIIALSDDELVAFVVRDGKLGAPELRLHLSAQIVMAQWAIGRFVSAWTSKLRPLLGAP